CRSVGRGRHDHRKRSGTERPGLGGAPAGGTGRAGSGREPASEGRGSALRDCRGERASCGDRRTGWPARERGQAVIGASIGSGARRGPSAAAWRTAALLVVGYAGYYLCRSNLSVSIPLIVADFAARGSQAQSVRVWLGSVASLGVLAYAI